MSALHRQILKPGLLSMPPTGTGRTANRAMYRRRDYTPVKWDKYFERCEEVKTSEDNVFRVYRSGTSGPLLLFLHGGGYCGLTWATLTISLSHLIECQMAAIDLRGHGESVTSDDDDLSAGTLSKDVGDVINILFGDTAPPIILVGHSMGGAVAVHAAYQDLIPSLIGLAVIDVVEGTAMDALQSMQTFLRSRPTSFKSIESAIEWCVRSGQIRNIESAKVSMPGQIKNAISNKPGTSDLEKVESSNLNKDARTIPPTPMVIQRGNSIPEEQEEETESDEKKDEEKETDRTHNSVEQLENRDRENALSSSATDQSHPNAIFVHPSESVTTRYVWRIDLSKTEKYWSGWFQGLSNMFLACNVPKLLLLAGIDRLDKELTIGQMQGKFQMQVLPQCGHAVHEDVPDKVADVLASFMVRHKFVQPTANYQPTFPAC